MTFGEIIKTYRKKLGLTQVQLGEKVFKSSQVISNWERGYTTGITPDDIKNVASVLRIPIDLFIGSEIPQYATERPEKTFPVLHKPVTMIPIFGRVVAGDPREPVQDIIGYTPITEHEARQGEYFALKACGASMEPTFSDGDILVVKKQETVDDGQIAIVLIGDEATVKRIYCDERGVSIIADNAAVFRPRLYTNEEAETLPIRILGRVVKVTRDV